MYSYEVGDWVWSNIYNEPAQVVAIESIWNNTYIQAWLPTSGTLVTLNLEDITPIDNSKLLSVSRLVYLIAASKIQDVLNTELLVTPIEADIILLPHQLYTLRRALSSSRIRYLLADEVGLGKTIEAGMILKELKKQGLVKRTLVVAPRGLTKQWVDEMQTRFNEPFHLIIPSVLIDFHEDNIWRRSDQVVCSLDSVKPLKARSGWTSERIRRYNQRRFRDLLAAGWDLIIVDEGHKLAGSKSSVARHELGVALSEASPYILLLSATPHQGKSEQFKRLMSLIDAEAFSDEGAIRRETVLPFVIRTEKRQTVDMNGNPLFASRKTKLIPVDWKSEHKEQRRLYEEVTDYVRYGYNKAIEEKRTYIGFLMVLMQRLVSSSTRAIRTSLERRLNTLETAPSVSRISEPFEEEWGEITGQQKLDEILARIGVGLRDEREEVKRLAALARRCELLHPDARAETLVNLIYKQRGEENDPKLKFLVFTEYVPTQEMLKEFLEMRAFEVVCINGSMDLKDRLNAQRQFADTADIMISTEAGGEGINLQFCHIVVNYDLPWNPMRLEQRIGRVDRIGQTNLVKVYNFVFNNTVEHRVREILEEKLAIILEEFGVDKLGDVLDSAENESDFEKLYMEAILHPDEIEQNVSKYFDSIRERIKSELLERNILRDEKTINIAEFQELAVHPLPYWVERMIINYIQSEGGQVAQTPSGYNLKWPDGTEMGNITFLGEQSQIGRSTKLTLSNERIQHLVEQKPIHAPGMPISKVLVKQISPDVSGYWSLWWIQIIGGRRRVERIFPVFLHDDGRVLKPTAFQLWNLLLQESTEIKCISAVLGTEAESTYTRLKKEAENQGRDLLRQAENIFRQQLIREMDKQEVYFRLRRHAISRLKDVKRREKQLKALELEEQEWSKELEKTRTPVFRLQAVLIIHLRGSDV